MNGTARFVTVVVLFLAQVFGVAMGVADQLSVVAFSVLTAVAAAGVPSGSLPIIVLVLLHFGIPGEGLALVLGVERILDMGRTVVNVTGDAAAACYQCSVERRNASSTLLELFGQRSLALVRNPPSGVLMFFKQILWDLGEMLIRSRTSSST